MAWNVGNKLIVHSSGRRAFLSNSTGPVRPRSPRNFSLFFSAKELRRTCHLSQMTAEVPKKAHCSPQI